MPNLRTSGVFSLGALGGDGAALTRPTRRWGGMLGRSLTTDVDKAPVVDHSLRFDGTADYLTRSQTTPTATTKWTWSGWAKLSTDSTAEQELLGGGPSGDQAHLSFYFNRLGVRRWYNAAHDINTYTTQTFTDTSAWNHFVVAYDSTQGSVKIWVNSRPESLVAADGSSVVYPAANAVMSLNKAGESHFIGRRAHSGAYWFNGQLAEVHFIDGQALDASYFGETRNSQWVPKEVTGVTYGNNGFYLDFADSSTASALGTDATTNGNDFTVPANTLTPDDQLIDTPNLRFATWDPSFRGGTTGEVLSEGNLKYYCPVNNENYVAATESKTSGKWYFETLYDGSTNNTGQGIVGWTYDDISQATSSATNPLDLGYGGMFGFQGWAKVDTASSTAVLQAPSANDVIGVAFDADTQRIWFSVQGSWVEGDPGTGTVATSYGALTSGKTYIPFMGHYSANSARKTQAILNFGQDHTFAGALAPLSSPYDDGDNGEFRYQPPSGFKALTTKIVGSDAVLQSTGVMSLAEHYQSKLPQP